MAERTQQHFGIYPSRATAEPQSISFSRQVFGTADISVLMADNEGSRDFAAEKNTKAPEGAVTGVGVGGTVGEQQCGRKVRNLRQCLAAQPWTHTWWVH